MTTATFDVRPISVAEARPIRQAVLRPGQPPESTVYPDDEAPGAWHVGAFDGKRLIGIASIYREARPGERGENGYRLRGMAVLPSYQGQGQGRALVQACVVYCLANGGQVLWCNGRVSAEGFYRACGFTPVGEIFDLPFSGPHYVFVRKLAQPNSVR